MYLIRFIIFFSALATYLCDEVTCKLTKSSPVNVNKEYNTNNILIILQPFPNLKKCFRHNDAACCNIINDVAISEYIASYIPEECLRIFPELEDLLCFGCSANESKYTSDGKLKICKNFAKKIWKVEKDEDLDKPSTRFDMCGLLAEENNFEDVDGDDFGYIIPSKEFNSFEEFINKLKIPYYEDLEIVVVDGDANTCFDLAQFIKFNKMFIFFLLIILFSF